ncbi:conserved hypothetical protein [Anaeromyxobacter dehalogenans 2CP-1]|uniref:Uncharacterized protein n=1 Tax=Anaeromyxobacter dehalogenans (strain ATCC BAA-258 / DSM 21875 / 2CP-1) TaxID=455488 RepID=B8J6M5_ANAD2|nr:hypothetical protein [Anaeromyxobacter dehalogenans]ACL66997.1 conserved hypothetical protein [Anaeromyxobacter dehalogenans 2CP-1]
MTGRRWNPADGHPVAPEQLPPRHGAVHPDGSEERPLWAPSEGPCRTETGGAGGEPDGRGLPIRRVSWD